MCGVNLSGNNIIILTINVYLIDARTSVLPRAPARGGGGGGCWLIAAGGGTADTGCSSGSIDPT